jgi:hypothetical protein
MQHEVLKSGRSGDAQNQPGGAARGCARGGDPAGTRTAPDLGRRKHQKAMKIAVLMNQSATVQHASTAANKRVSMIPVAQESQRHHKRVLGQADRATRPSGTHASRETHASSRLGYRGPAMHTCQQYLRQVHNRHGQRVIPALTCITRCWVTAGRAQTAR